MPTAALIREIDRSEIEPPNGGTHVGGSHELFDSATVSQLYSTKYAVASVHVYMYHVSSIAYCLFSLLGLG